MRADGNGRGALLTCAQVEAGLGPSHRLALPKRPRRRSPYRRQAQAQGTRAQKVMAEQMARRAAPAGMTPSGRVLQT